ncbi:MAG TPA: hypothetical protein VFL69_14565 [Marmoricola sp.]|jgi:hypothetical protein|nr:hypothetical protein [Marmoricola sp.]
MDYKPNSDDFVLQMGGARPEDIQHHFEPPIWLSDRGTTEDAGKAVKTAPAIPHQAVPAHDEAGPARPTIPTEARWKAKHKVRTFFALLLVPLLGAAVAGGYYAWSIGLMEYLPVAAIPALVIVGIWGAMINTTPAVTTLKGSKVAVRHDGRTEEFDLANPDQAIETTRDARDPRWKVVFERIDGSQLVLTRKHVPPAEFMAILRHYRQIAAELLEQRLRRYQGS